MQVRTLFILGAILLAIGAMWGASQVSWPYTERCVVRPLTAREIAPEELYLDNGTRTTQQASRVGNSWGLKPADKSSTAANHRRLLDQSCDLG